MTWSILARDPDTGLFGLAVASRFFAVGAVCPFSGPHGAAMTQARVNPELGRRAHGLLADGYASDAVRDLLVHMDAGRDTRQLHVMDRTGRAAAHTGKACVDWAGHEVGDGVSVAGNMLVGPEVISATLAAWQAGAGTDIVKRLLGAMDAGEAAGGDKRGRQSAALRVQGPETYARLDIRADDHPEPLAELRRLYGVARERYLAFSTSMPRPARPQGIIDDAALDAAIERHAGKPISADFWGEV